MGPSMSDPSTNHICVEEAGYVTWDKHIALTAKVVINHLFKFHIFQDVGLLINGHYVLLPPTWNKSVSLLFGWLV